MKKLEKIIVDGCEYLPVYVVNDWGADGSFVGTNYRQSSAGTHSLRDQTDRRLVGGEVVMAYNPMFAAPRRGVIRVEKGVNRVSDMGHEYTVSTDVVLYVDGETGLMVPADQVHLRFLPVEAT